jgi:hypothetical protein
MTDGSSRYLVRPAATGSGARIQARPLFERAFKDPGLPGTALRRHGGARKRFPASVASFIQLQSDGFQ